MIKDLAQQVPTAYLYRMFTDKGGHVLFVCRYTDMNSFTIISQLSPLVS